MNTAHLYPAPHTAPEAFTIAAAALLDAVADFDGLDEDATDDAQAVAWQLVRFAVQAVAGRFPAMVAVLEAARLNRSPPGREALADMPAVVRL